MRTLHEIRLFFDRTLGTPVIARELAGKSKEAGWYRHDCSRFTAPAWGKTEKLRELSEEIRGRVHFLASRLTNEETESPRVLRRLQLLREWSHEQVYEVFP